MNDKEIDQFMKAFEDFAKHSEVQEAYYLGRQRYQAYQKTSQKVIHDEIEQKAAELEVTVDYYMAEFM
jgi:hypothetical protein